MTLHRGEPGRCGRLGQGQHLCKTGPRGNRGPNVGDGHASAQHDGTEFIQTLGAEDEFPTSAEPIDELDVNLEFDVYVSPTVLTAGILSHPVWRETVFLENVLRERIPL